MGVSSKLLLDVTGAHSASELDSGYSLNDRGALQLHTHKNSKLQI